MTDKTIQACAVDGCESKPYVKGMCSKHYQRVMKHGDPNANPNQRREPIDRFWEKVEKTDTCWNWIGFQSPEGYPRFYAGDSRKGTILAHRWIFAHVNGPIPQDKHVDHICRNRACVRPDHLRLLTPAENGLYAQQSCRWVAKSIEDIEKLAAENVKSISVERSAILELIALARAGLAAPTDMGIPASGRATIEEAAQVLESAAAHNRAKGRTVLERTQQDRADRLRAILAAPTGQQAEPVACRGCDPAEGFCRACREAERKALAAPTAPTDTAKLLRCAVKYNESIHPADVLELVIFVERCAAMSAAQAQPKDTTDTTKGQA